MNLLTVVLIMPLAAFFLLLLVPRSAPGLSRVGALAPRARSSPWTYAGSQRPRSTSILRPMA
jgi:hypothetical protein